MKSKYLFHVLSLGFISLIVIFISCDDNIVDNNIDQMIIPSSNVSYSQHIQPIFNAKCLGSGCHNDQDQAGNLSLTNWSETRTAVFPGLPGNSQLVWRIEGQGVAIMPPPTAPVTPLTENHITGIKKWIEEGAENN